jgi:hypothetical protein
LKIIGPVQFIWGAITEEHIEAGAPALNVAGAKRVVVEEEIEHRVPSSQ